MAAGTLDDEQVLLELTTAWQQAIVDNDAEAIPHHMHPDWVLVDHDGIGTRAEFLALVGSGQLTHSAMDSVDDTVRVRVYADLAVVTSRVRNTARFDGQDHHADEWTTDVFARTATGWLCVLSQATWSFDHGFWLAGEADLSIDGLRRVGVRPWLYDLDVGTASATGLREAADRVEALTATSIRAVTETVPLEWGLTSEELSTIADLLCVRAEGVTERLRVAADHSEYA